jgi:hypothetical protein
MAEETLDPSAEAARALHAAVEDYGTRALSNPQVLTNLFKDLLPTLPREASLLVQASEAGVPDLLVGHVGQQIPPDAAVQLTAATLAQRRALDPAACCWAAAQFATALGYQVEVPPATAPVASPPPAPAGVGPADPGAPVVAPTVEPWAQAPPPPPIVSPPVVSPPAPSPAAYPPAALGDPGETLGVPGAGGWAPAGGPPVGPPPGGAPPVGAPPMGGYPPSAPPYGTQPPGVGGPPPGAGGPPPYGAGTPPPYGAGGGWGGATPTPPKSSRRGPLIFGGVAGLIVIIVVVALVLAAGGGGGGGGKTPPTTEAAAPTTVATTTTEAPTTAAPAGFVDLSQLLPEDLDTSSDCQAIAQSDQPNGMVGSTEADVCKDGGDSSQNDPGVPGGNVYGFQFDNSADFIASLQAFNADEGFSATAADTGANCPPPTGDSGGQIGWHDSHYQGELECYSNTSSAPVYVWTIPAQNAIIAAVGGSGETATQLDSWWTDFGGPSS